ncbi:efflux RND transporter periplasmic adaptor subunit (plasmid) [Streptoverticillium reticulum]|uniref:efflux RND transporter periplasmic adaptor subunit n=1 Tax=Streptoverticillium reticulum TaxID=1433415 RepID=UPI0039BFF48E
MQRKHVFAGLGAAAVLIGGVSVAAGTGGPPVPAAGTAAAPGAGTARIQQGDMTDSSARSGTLDYSDPRQVSAAVGGTITWTPTVGTAVSQDQVLYRLNGKPVYLLYGDVPMYRTLKRGTTGDDVRQLQRDLRALGYRSAEHDGTFGPGTQQAVKEWQAKHGLDATGRLDPSRIAFLPDTARITKNDAQTGSRIAPGTAVLTASGAKMVVNIPVYPSEQQSLSIGKQVHVQLPDGKTATGKVTQIGGPARNGAGSSTTSSGDSGPQKINIQVALTGSAADLDKLAGSQVSVSFPGTTQRNVLSVPVGALLAQDSSGFAVQIKQPDGALKTVPVTLGVFSNGRVQITGNALKPGMDVVVAGR